MNLADLKRASDMQWKLEAAQSQGDALLEYSVVGMVVDRGEGSLEPHRIERGGQTPGGGTISSIGWADDMQKALTDALHKVFEDRIAAAKAELVALGVEV